jgi:hypothetical protein
MPTDCSQPDYAWLVFGLIKQDENSDRTDLTCRIPGSCTIVYCRGEVACAMRFGCPYWIRIEGQGWGMIVTTLSTGVFCRALKGDRRAAERDLFLLRMYLPLHD